MYDKEIEDLLLNYLSIVKKFQNETDLCFNAEDRRSLIQSLIARNGAIEASRIQAFAINEAACILSTAIDRTN